MLKTYDVPEIVSPVVPKVEPKSGNISQSRRKTLQESIPCNDHITFGSYTMSMNGNYHAFLVRFQRRDVSTQWYVTLENAHTHEMFRFATVRELFIYLLQILTEEPVVQTDHPNPEVESDR